MIRLRRILAGLAADPDVVKGNPMAPAAFGMLSLWVNSSPDDQIIAQVRMVYDTLHAVLFDV